MRWVDTGDDAHGIIAVGRVATGFLAIGQVAHGAIAIGQFAFGVVALGQVAVGAFAVGTVVLGLWQGLGLAGLAGRGRGLVLSVLPRLGARRSAPPLGSWNDLSDPEKAGFARVSVEAGPAGPLVFEGGRRVDVRVDALLARSLLPQLPVEGWARLRSSARGPVVDELQLDPAPAWRRPDAWATWIAQVGGLALVGAVVWWSVVRPLASGWFGPQGVLFE